MQRSVDGSGMTESGAQYQPRGNGLSNKLDRYRGLINTTTRIRKDQTGILE